MAPLVVMCDPKDLQAVAQVRSPFTNAPTVFLYEVHPGGVGLARGVYDAHHALLGARLEPARGGPTPPPASRRRRVAVGSGVRRGGVVPRPPPPRFPGPGRHPGNRRDG